MQQLQLTDFLPTTKKELTIRGWDEVDVVIFSGDAYIDHPSFGAAVMGRVIESEGYKVAIVPQPDWRGDHRDFKKMGRPRLFFAISAGCMDSMVNHYTANKRLRSDDAYSANGQAGLRPDYATITYAYIIKELYPDVPLVIGGIEASLRRFTHYDYWSDSLKPSILIDSKADLLVYGMGEQPIRALLDYYSAQKSYQQISEIPQVSYLVNPHEHNAKNSKWNSKSISSHGQCLRDKKKYASNFKIIEEASNKQQSDTLIQEVGDKMVVVNPPFPLMTESEIDATYNLPFTRQPHPKYKGKHIPAFEMIKFSVNMHRGCFGGCSFCTISAHQGKFIVSRSKASILKEVKLITKQPDFKGYLSDMGGPSANMYKMQGYDLSICSSCKRPSCIHPAVCKNLNTSHQAMLDIFKEVDILPSIKKSFIGSGVRYDLLLHRATNEKENQSHSAYTKELIQKHVSGRLKVAPEHTSDKVLNLMRKPSFKLFKDFKKQFDKLNQEAGLKQQLIPYFISSHPLCTEEDMAELACEVKQLHFSLEQVQDFTPTPMTLATVMYYSGYDPYTLKPVHTAKSKQEKLNQQQFFFWYKKEFRQRIISVLRKLNREDLVKRLFGR